MMRIRSLLTAAVLVVMLVTSLGCGIGDSSSSGGPSIPPIACPGVTTIAKAGPLADYVLDVLNAMRACNGVAALTRDTAAGAPLDAYATVGCALYAAGGIPHAHWNATPYPPPYTANKGGENQGGSVGQPTPYDDLLVVLVNMYNEGPGGGHHDNIVNPTYTRVGIGLDFTGGGVWQTQDFTTL